MDRYHIVKSFLSDLDLEKLREWEDAALGRFILFPFIEDPAKDAPNQLREELELKSLGSIGEIGSQLLRLGPNDPRLDPYFSLAEEFDVPVLIHTEGIGPPIPCFRSAAGRLFYLKRSWFAIQSLGYSWRIPATLVWTK